MWSSGHLQVHCQPLCGDIIGVRIMVVVMRSCPYLRWSPSPSRLEGSHKVVWGDFTFFMEQAKQHVHWVFSNPSSQVVHNRHLLLRGGATKLSILCERYWLLNLATYMWATHGFTSQNKQCQSKKILHAWSMRFWYVILAHKAVAPPYTSRSFFIHVDCHLMNRNPL
jgi:hypothetical protein